MARRLVIGSRGLPRLEIGPRIEALFTSQRADLQAAAETGPRSSARRSKVPRRKPLDVPTEELSAALKAARWDLKATARALGLSRTSLYTLLRSVPASVLRRRLTTTRSSAATRNCAVI